MNDLQLKALEAHDNGWMVVAVHLSFRKNSDGFYKKEKVRPMKWEFMKEEGYIQTEDEVAEMFQDDKKWNTVAIVTGRNSGLTCIDVDKDENGNYKADTSYLPLTYKQSTPSGGEHWYYKFTENIKQSQGNTFPGLGEVDVREQGGLVFFYAKTQDGVDSYYAPLNAEPLSDAPDHLFVTQSPAGSFKNTILDDVIHESMTPQNHSRNTTLFNYFISEMKVTAKEEDFERILDKTLESLADISTSEPESSIRATFKSAKNLIMKDRQGMDEKEIIEKVQKGSKSKQQEYFQRIEEHFVRENDRFVVYVREENIEMYEYKDGVYLLATKAKVKGYIQEYIKEKNIYQFNKDNFHNEVYNRLCTYLQTVEARHFEKIDMRMNVKNGYLNVKTRKITPHSKDVFSIVQLDIEYNPEAVEMPLFQSYLDVVEQGSEGTKIMLQELAGYVLSDGNKRQKVHFLYGKTGNNGKSVYWKILQALLGVQNVTMLKLDAFKSSGNHELSNLVDKKLNISDETQRSYIDSPLYTDLSSEGSFTVNPKNKPGYLHKCLSNFLIAGNFYPKFKDAVGMKRRLIIIPFNHKVTQEEMIIGLEDKIIQSELEAILNWALEGLDRVEANNCFYISEHSKENTVDFEDILNPIGEYVRNELEKDAEGFASMKDLYGKTDYRDETGYIKFIKESGKKPLDFNNFKQDLRTFIEEGGAGEGVEYNAIQWNKISKKSERGVRGLKIRELTTFDEDDNFGTKEW